MTIKEKLANHAAIERENREKLEAWKAEGRKTVSPTEAAKLLGCNPYSLNLAAKEGHMPRGSSYFAGRNLRIMVRWLVEMVSG